MTQITVTSGKTTNIGSSEVTPTTGTIAGTVTNQKGSPISGAEVSAVPAEHRKTVTSVTNGSGEYSITVPAGSYALFMRASGVGYATSAEFPIAGGQSVHAGTTEIAQTVGSISGIITDDKGAPISGATVKTVKGVFLISFREWICLECITNAEGEYTITDMPEGGPYELEVTAPGYANNEPI